MVHSVAAVVCDGLAPFEFGVVCEVFGLDRSEDGVPPFDFRVCGPVAGSPVRTSVGAQVVPDHGLDATDDADLLIVPAIRIGSHYPPEVLDAVRRASDRGALLLSVCSGVFVLAAAGVIEGRRVTTHWMHADELRRRYPSLDIDPDVLFVDDGNLVTSAGTAAGIDACLHLVRRELGAKVANTIARRMVVAPQREGGQRQFIERPVPECEEDSFAELLEWMTEHLDESLTVRDLARRAHTSERTFARSFVAQTGTTPLAWLTSQRVAHAQSLLEESSLDLEEVARRCGFGSAALLRHHFRRAVGITPTEYRQTFRFAA
ncbi:MULTISPECIES: helix-turn-helix domain-containing protein [Cellulosimicrobium]|uniref:Helix-turn-helix domain-containing protein n=1 Tax=Cellulosimicrobium sp. ES-005 TaxID=3163031 RepID=A0AAU8G562_9MICO|nr:helix-turn-helix domain-containing protein [Cellulosimicrobium cellulans]MCO7272353.1 helix-turn-helix domain-containing protein [Cellulosimicrobium cellulans]